MMLSELTLILLGLSLFTTVADAKAEESLQLKVFNRDYKASDKQIHELLKKADLESHGYKKELVTKVVSENGSDKQLFEKSFFYYKIVNCTRLKEINQELETLLQGAIGPELVTKINKEIKTKKLTKMKQCKTGLEVHFKETGSCRDKKNKSRRSKRGCAWFCLICININVSR